MNVEVAPGRYTTVRRKWNAGDVVELTLPMEPRLLQAHPLVEETRGQVAVMRGPIVYCLESVDLPEETVVMNVRLPRDIDWKPRFDADLLGGVAVLEGQAAHSANLLWSDSPYDSNTLYQELGPTKTQPLRVHLIPYHAWLNRGISQMTVWIPLAVAWVRVVRIAVCQFCKRLRAG